ncbi:hypothetical protein ACLB2K_032753 [Fragaria x ananassa]
MAPTRKLQVSGPSTTLPCTTVIPPLPHHNISSFSYQPDEVTPQQVEELHTAFEILQSENNNHRTDYPYYHPPKIDLPRFHGEDAAGWLAMTDRYIRTYRIPPHERVATLAAHFGPDASMWMSAFEQRHPVVTWEQFVSAFLEHFGSSSSGDVLATLSHLPQMDMSARSMQQFHMIYIRSMKCPGPPALEILKPLHEAPRLLFYENQLNGGV